ncbi:MAG: TIGR04283 family arsenosugar biosynthesis glycosyltransferase [Flavobacteriaceae bacterium]|nr:TIGR04283 family arsenosugar biosynthesis glycosyltransferase [Flavobacteriaceae bacterium]
MKKHKLSIIIPILNEVETIGNLLQHLLDNSSKDNITEIIVVDGGSTDGSQNIVINFTQQNQKYHRFLKPVISNIKLLNSKRGRAKQMNLGAENATGNILYFLHADSFPPKAFDQLIINEIEKTNLAGCFRMQFDHNHWWLRLASWLTQFRWRTCRGGDQSQFITKELFNEIGGFDENYVIYEDNILINELYSRNEFVVIQHKIKTSARSYKRNGVWKLQYHFWAIYVKRWFGASSEEIYRYYKKNVI